MSKISELPSVYATYREKDAIIQLEVIMWLGSDY